MKKIIALFTAVLLMLSLFTGCSLMLGGLLLMDDEESETEASEVSETIEAESAPPAEEENTQDPEPAAAPESAEPAEESAPTDESLPQQEGPSGDRGFYEEGDLASSFTLPTPDGGSISLADLKGTPIVLNFWATWCGYCCEELPEFDQLSADYAGKAQVLAVNVGEDTETVSSFLAENGYTLPVALDEYGEVDYPTNILPYTMVLDAEGRVYFTILGGARGNMYDILSDVLSELA